MRLRGLVWAESGVVHHSGVLAEEKGILLCKEELDQVLLVLGGGYLPGLS